MKVYYYETILGKMRIAEENEVIVEIVLDKLNYPLKDDYEVKETPLIKQVMKEINEYFNGERKQFDFPFRLNGTEFQNKVWNSLCDIPYGETKTYKQIAEAIGSPKASRAVGLANNKNRLIIVVPCHRVIGSNGKMVGYAGGIDLKEKLLNIEEIEINKVNGKI